MDAYSRERVFVVVIDEIAIVAFQARSIGEAMELGREAWFREDLKHLTSGRLPVWDGKAAISVRTARPEEAERYHRDLLQREPVTDDLPLVFLVDIDERLEVADSTPHGAFPPRR